MLVDLILQSLCPKKTEQAKYLEKLREPTRRLWRELREPKPAVDYSDRACQAAYMLRYFAPYSQIIPNALDIARGLTRKELLPDKKEISVSFLGPGPCPEVFGLCQYASENRPAIKKIIAHTFDLYSEAWKDCRRLVRSTLIPTLLEGLKCSTVPHAVDIADDAQLKSKMDAIVGQDLIVAQYFWNELPDATALSQFKKIMIAIPKQVPVLFIDSGNYDRRKRLLATFAKDAKATGLSVRPLPAVDEYPLRRDLIDLPEIVNSSLFVKTDGLWYRRKITYSGLLISRN